MLPPQQAYEVCLSVRETYVALYTRCDCIADFRRAWVHFEKQFNNK